MWHTENHRCTKNTRSNRHTADTQWCKITRNGPYGLVIVDPPSYQKGSFIATKDYAKLMRRLPELLAPGGYALLCLNAPELGLSFLQDQMKELAPELNFVQRVVPVGEQLAEALRIAQAIAAQAPLAVEATRLNVLKAVEYGPVVAMNEFMSVQKGLANSQDAAEGVLSFVEKRAARFTGR